METKKENLIDSEAMESNAVLTDSLRAIANEVMILGLKESLSALNNFLDKKVGMGYPEYISRRELKTFLETYIKESEANFR